MGIAVSNGIESIMLSSSTTFVHTTDLSNWDHATEAFSILLRSVDSTKFHFLCRFSGNGVPPSIATFLRLMKLGPLFLHPKWFFLVIATRFITIIYHAVTIRHEFHNPTSVNPDNDFPLKCSNAVAW
jgi:hypothetical protein